MTARQAFDLSLYLIADPAIAGEDRLPAIVAAAAAGGVTLVQLRAKQLSTRSFLSLAGALKAVLDPLGVPLIVNDRLDIALAIGAAGLHVGQDDLPAAEARRFLGPAAIVGVTARTVAEAQAADPAVADYLGTGPIRATATKSDTAPPKGVEGFRAVRREMPFPVVAIGGIDAGLAGPLIAAGADGVAVAAAICAATDPRAAAADIAARVKAARA
jgi:thiamine-phosphate pyrophosphorylase